MTRAAPVDIDRFRREVRDFLKEHLPGWLRDKVLRHEPLVKADYLAWQRVLLERGWMCPTWPTEYGGPGRAGRRCRHIFLKRSAGCSVRQMCFRSAPRCLRR